MKPSTEEKISGDIGGVISIKFRERSDFDEICRKEIPEYDASRFEAFALRFYFSNEPILTVYAIDKSRQEGSNFDKSKMPVKKFKLTGINISRWMQYVEEINFTLTTGNYPIDDMEVINK